jgi:CheY-like chemotaxis protein
MAELNKILLVDDDEAFNFLNRNILIDNGVNCTIHEVLNGRAALDYLERNEKCPDVILLDINMPVMDGHEFLEQLAQGNKCAGTSRIFILTSSLRDEDRIKSLKNELVKGYFEKPLNGEHVKIILASAGK